MLGVVKCVMLDWIFENDRSLEKGNWIVIKFKDDIEEIVLVKCYVENF